jgi:hypothetical protein
MRDCKYDLDRGYLKLEMPDSKTGVASIFFAECLTPANQQIHGTLTQAVTQSLGRIDHQSTKRRDLDGGITVGKHQVRPAAQPLLHDQTVPITRDEKAMIIKADYLGLTSGTDIEISHGKETLTYAIVNDEISHLVMNDDSKMCECVNLVNPDEDVPQTIAAIFRHRDRREWLDSVLQEYTNLASKGTWRIALLPKGRKMLGCRLVLKRKMDKNGNMSSRKARCVIQGYTQVEGVDYQRLFQPVAALNTLRNQCCFALQRQQDLRSWDFEQAFVQSDMDTDIYVRWPPGIVPPRSSDRSTPSCLHVKKAQYGCKQSPRCWGLKLHNFLVREGFHRSDTDSCLYLLTNKREKPKLPSDPNYHDDFDAKYTQIALVVYVDDLTARVDLECPETKAIYDNFVTHMRASFVVEDRGVCDSMLGYKIDYDKKAGILKLTQKSCLLQLLERNQLTTCDTKHTPAKPGIKPHVKWCPDPDTAEGKSEILQMKKNDYPNRVGAQLWLSRGSRPETSWTVGMLSRFLCNPSLKHYDMSTHLLKYLSTTKDRGIVYRRSKGPLKLTCYVDGDWLTDYGNNEDNRKCTTGYVLILCGAAVCWRSFKQQRVSGSSTESEYYSLWAATREIMHTRRQMKECGFEQYQPTEVHEDNQAVKRLSEDVVESSRTRHWDKEFHQLREEFNRGTMITQYIDTKLNAADILTKSVDVATHERHTDTMCGLDWEADRDQQYQQTLPPDRRSNFYQNLYKVETNAQELAGSLVPPVTSCSTVPPPVSAKTNKILSTER